MKILSSITNSLLLPSFALSSNGKLSRVSFLYLTQLVVMLDSQYGMCESVFWTSQHLLAVSNSQPTKFKQ